MKQNDNTETQNKTEAGKMKLNELEIGMKIYYRGDMANSEGFGEITHLIHTKWGNDFTVKLDDGREFKSVPVTMIDNIDTGNCSTTFCTLEAYKAKRKEQLELIKSL